MAPIPEAAVLNLSHYQVDDYLTCPLKYKYVHILRLPFFHHTIIYGKAVHSAIECYYRHRIHGIPVTQDDLEEAFESAWRSIGFLSKEHHDRRKKAGKESIRRFFENEEKSGGIPVLVEEKFSFMLAQNRISGRWDRVDQRGDSIVIVDFKSSEIHTQDAADTRVKESLQLAIYAMAYARTFDRVPDEVELHFLESGLVGHSVVTEKMFKKTEETILKAAEGIRRRDYTAKPDYQSCRYCAYSSVCPGAIRT
jgi:DNA helicase-2/ATP-dependent DNA helicase PcrA